MNITIEKKTDQLNYEDFLHGVTRLVQIEEVERGNKEQQYDIAIVGDKRYWRPAVTVLKLLVEAWGDDATAWVGRYALLYGDPTVKFGNDVVGGIRVSHLSHLEKTLVANLTETRGRRRKHTVEPLTTEGIKAGLRDEYRTADPERRKAIEAEVATLDGDS